MSIVLVSAVFGNKFNNAKRRFIKQFNNSNLIDNLFIFDDDWLASIKIDIPLNTFVSSFVWKPIVILEIMNQINDNDILIYLDIGCEFNDEMLFKAISAIKNHGSTFMLLNHDLKSWISPKLFGKGPFDNINSNSKCVAAGTLFLVKDCATFQLISEWHKWATEENSIYAIGSGSNIHRHDQSILSAIIYNYSFNIILDNCYVDPKNFLQKNSLVNSFAVVLRNKSSVSILSLRKFFILFLEFFPSYIVNKTYFFLFRLIQRFF